MARPSFPSDRADQLPVRFPLGMRDQVRALAKQNRRSMNSEIILAIEHWLEDARAKGAISLVGEVQKGRE